MQGLYRLLIRGLERKEQRPQQHRSPGASFGKFYSKHTPWNSAHCLPFCCNLLLYINLPLPKSWAWVVDVLPVTLYTLPSRKLSESGHFLSDPVCLWQPSFLPCPPLPSLPLSSLPPCPSAVFAQHQPASPWVSCSCVMYSHVWPRSGTLTPLWQRAMVDSGWAWLPFHILAGGKTSCSLFAMWGRLHPW